MSEIKPLLRQMIDNNNPYWRTRTIRGAHNLLDEYEAKVEAFDAVLKSYDKSYSNSHLGDEVIGIIRKYESGDYDVKK